jgi:hypothetical protein
VKEAIRLRSAELRRALVAERTGLDLSHLTPAEEKVVEAVSEYVGVMKRQGKDATRTLLQIRNRGLLGAAEAAPQCLLLAGWAVEILGPAKFNPMDLRDF